jgi:hypothetical protein
MKTRVSAVLTLLLLLPAAAAAADNGACVTAAELGDKLRRNPSQLTKAREQLLLCARDECPAVVSTDCRGWLAEVDASLPTIVLAAQNAAGQDVTEVTVRADGALLTERLDGLPITIDAGPHTLTFEMTGAPPVTVQVLARAGRKNAPVTARFADGSTQPSSAAATTAPPLPEQTVPPSAPSAPVLPPHASALPAVGVAVAGAGVVALGVGVFFGLSAKSKQADANCPDNVCRTTSSPPGDASALRDAKSLGNTSTALFVVGGALAAGGITLWLLTSRRGDAPSATARVSPTAGAGFGGLTLTGTL